MNEEQQKVFEERKVIISTVCYLIGDGWVLDERESETGINVYSIINRNNRNKKITIAFDFGNFKNKTVKIKAYFRKCPLHYYDKFFDVIGLSMSKGARKIADDINKRLLVPEYDNFIEKTIKESLAYIEEIKKRKIIFEAFSKMLLLERGVNQHDNNYFFMNTSGKRVGQICYTEECISVDFFKLTPEKAMKLLAFYMTL
ncbi:hypothetical protein HLB25_21245 [Dickeya dadantii]|uniref:hypothetical protein n=1 Tax=Dickeya dadantii TaxID=204038 RepID=UPI001495DE71|nr:hypothetical protein [Dickeya dadantii]NPE56593.1 hypothetical protein [Dickeya dadantii]NPE69039.1 hypothetical protein [Dickeya dadantii]